MPETSNYDLDRRVTSVEQRLDIQERLNEARHQANTARLDSLGKSVEGVSAHLTRQDETTGTQLSQIATKLAIADGAKAERLEIAARLQNRWYLIIAGVSAFSALFGGLNLFRHIIP